MKYFLSLFVCASLYAAKAPLVISGAKELAKMDPDSGEITYSKGTNPDEVIRSLVQTIVDLQKRLTPPKPEPKKK